MQITLSPMRRDDRLAASVAGDVLTLTITTPSPLGGDAAPLETTTALDFGAILEGDTLPQDAAGSDWIASDVVRRNGEVQLTLIVPHGADAPNETLFPPSAPLQIASGPVPIPPYETEAES